MKTLEQKYGATDTAMEIAMGAGNYSDEVRQHARLMVSDGYPGFKFAEQYPENADPKKVPSAYIGATLWVCGDTTRTINREYAAARMAAVLMLAESEVK